MSKWQNKLSNLFYGRYGVDELYQFGLIVYIVLFIVNLFFDSLLIFIVETVIVFITFFRVLSKNINRRRKENKVYLNIKERIRKKFDLIKRKWNDRKTHMYRKCRHCKTTLRLPLKKGVHTVKCPNCKKRFEVKCRRDEKIKVEVIKRKGLRET